MVFDELQKEHANPIVQQKNQSLFVWYGKLYKSLVHTCISINNN